MGQIHLLDRVLKGPARQGDKGTGKEVATPLVVVVTLKVHPHQPWKDGSKSKSTLCDFFSSAKPLLPQTGRTFGVHLVVKKKILSTFPGNLKPQYYDDLSSNTLLSVWMGHFQQDCGLYAPLSPCHPSSVSLLSGLLYAVNDTAAQ